MTGTSLASLVLWFAVVKQGKSGINSWSHSQISDDRVISKALILAKVRFSLYPCSSIEPP